MDDALKVCRVTVATETNFRCRLPAQLGIIDDLLEVSGDRAGADAIAQGAESELKLAAITSDRQAPKIR